MIENKVMNRVKTVFVSIAKMREADHDFKKKTDHNDDLLKMDLSHLYPKVTYDDWTVCYDEKEDKCYVIDFVDNVVEEVSVDACYRIEGTEILDESGKIVNTDNAKKVYESAYAGESDDCHFYMLFNRV